MIKKRWKSFIQWLKYYPKTATADGWVKWEREYKKFAPIRYFITHKLPTPYKKLKYRAGLIMDSLQDV
jgi:hypothetical protein